MFYKICLWDKVVIDYLVVIKYNEIKKCMFRNKVSCFVL